MPRTALIGLAICAALTSGFSARAGGGRGRQVRPAAGSECRTVELQPRPSWLFSGAWVRDGTELILPDTLAARLLRYKRSGQASRSTAIPVISPTFSRPSSITNTDAGLVLFDPPDRLVRLKADLQPASEIRLTEVKFSRGDRVEIFLSFIEVDDGLAGITSLVDGQTKERWLGIARLRLGDSPKVDRLRTLPSPMTEEGSFYYLHEGPFLANAGGGTYALVFGKDPHVEQLLPKPRTLAAFPAGYVSPALGRNGRDNTVRAFRTWEGSTAPVALFGRGRFLYLLARRPRGAEGSQWTLFQIDPQLDRIIRSTELPTRARHLVVVPGPREWAIVEKGSMAAAGRDFEQAVGPVLLIRSSAIEDPTARADLSKCLESRR